MRNLLYIIIVAVVIVSCVTDDTVHDFEVAEAMGVKAALVSNGHNAGPRLEATGAPVFDSLAGVREYILD